jgi:quercetin dioxygenase-like cupin family protein
MARTPEDQSLVVSGLTEQLPVTASATTSRSLVDNDRVRVVAFAFDTGEQLTEHTATMPVVVQVLQGRMRFEVAGEAHHLAAGDVVYLAANEPHSLEALEPTLMTLVMVRSPRD